MTQLLAYPSQTERYGLPLLYPAQAQKEFFINEALARLDAVVHPAVAGTAVAPPADAATGECWVVGADPGGVFAGHDNHLASFDGTQWTFIAPVLGMTLFDKSAGCLRHYTTGWSTPAEIAPPAGGSVVDAEARQAIVAIMQALEALSIIKQS